MVNSIRDTAYCVNSRSSSPVTIFKGKKWLKNFIRYHGRFQVESQIVPLLQKSYFVLQWTRQCTHTLFDKFCVLKYEQTVWKHLIDCSFHRWLGSDGTYTLQSQPESTWPLPFPKTKGTPLNSLVSKYKHVAVLPITYLLKLYIFASQILCNHCAFCPVRCL